MAALKSTPSTEATVHFEATTPLAIVDGAGVVAAPTYTRRFNKTFPFFRIRGDVAWADASRRDR